jgi:hypothetical protein
MTVMKFLWLIFNSVNRRFETKWRIVSDGKVFVPEYYNGDWYGVEHEGMALVLDTLPQAKLFVAYMKNPEKYPELRKPTFKVVG